MAESVSRFKNRQPVAIIGSSTDGPGTDAYETAYQIAGAMAQAGLVILCGGRTGVMEAACKGAHDAGGLSIGILPSMDESTANPYASVILTTDLGKAQNPVVREPVEVSRNRVIASAASCLVAIGGGEGTANEIKFALQFGKHVFGLCNAPEPEPGRQKESAGLYLPMANLEEAIREVLNHASRS